MSCTVTRMEWEKPYLDALIDRLRPCGDVLEVGFAQGFASTRIQTFHPTHHTIIESDPMAAAEAVKWAQGNPAITIIQDSWETALPQLKQFDAVFFNDFKPHLEADREIGNMVVESGKKLLAKVQEELPQLKTLQYSDGDLDEFFAQVGQFNPAEMAIFVSELKKNGQISTDQHEKMALKYRLEKKEAPASQEKQTDPVLVFLNACIKDHMRKGCRFSFFAGSPQSKYENPEFFETIITNPYFDYQERLMAVDVPASCPYYKYTEALVMVIEKYV